MTAITQDKIIEINRAYKAYGTYAAASRATGVSPATVKKYVITNFDDFAAESITRTHIEIPPVDVNLLKQDNLYRLTEEEKIELNEMRKEILI